MKRERLNDDEFLLVTPDEFEALRTSWEALGGEIDDVGNGVWLFLVDGSTQMRCRVQQTN